MKIAPVALLVPALALVAACGATSSNHSLSSTTSRVSRAAEPVPAAPGSLNSGSVALTGLAKTGAAFDSASTAGGAPTEATSTGSGAGGSTQSASIISKGQISLHTKDIDGARFNLSKLLDSWGGSIANEDSAADVHGKTDREHLELRVPSSTFDTAMNAISRLGTLVDRTRSSQDVTTDVIDNNTRVRSQKLSLARIQALLAQAKNLNQVIAIEDQLSQRQADLDSLEQQQKYLADQTSQATISVYLSVPPKHAGAKKHDHENSFVAGLKGGWHNLRGAIADVANAVGNVLPFGALLAVVVAPFWFARRRRLS